MFVLEFLIKLSAYGFKVYIQDPYNSFDAFIIAVSTMDTAVKFY